MRSFYLSVVKLVNEYEKDKFRHDKNGEKLHILTRVKTPLKINRYMSLTYVYRLIFVMGNGLGSPLSSLTKIQRNFDELVSFLIIFLE